MHKVHAHVTWCARRLLADWKHNMAQAIVQDAQADSVRTTPLIQEQMTSDTAPAAPVYPRSQTDDSVITTTTILVCVRRPLRLDFYPS